jgi:hypothetical protein
MRNSVQRPSDRDRSIEKLLQQSSRQASASVRPEECVDGEILAAWADGSLRTAQAATIERHVSDCARCQALLATFARTAPAEPAVGGAKPSFAFGWHMRWLVPLATAATVAAIWVAIPNNQRDANLLRPEISDALQQTPAERLPQSSPEPQSVPASPAPAPPQASPAPASPGARDRKVDEDVAAGREQEGLARRSDRASQTPEQNRTRANADEAKPSRQVRAPAAPGAREERAAAAEAPLVGALMRTAAIQIVSPNPSNRWRLTTDGRVEHSTDGGARWAAIALSSPVLIAGYSPAPTIAWLVGRGGAVYVTTDGTRFERVPFTEPVDLVLVVAIDDRQATITAADGRTFRTSDRGVTWHVVR